MKPHRRPVGAAFAVGFVLLALGQTQAGAGWSPVPGLRWQYQLQGVVNLDLCARAATARRAPCVFPDVYDIDLYADDGTTLDTVTVDAIHAQGAHVVCYVDAGTWEDWRPDAASYPPVVLGASNGWPGERWLDVRRTDVLLPIIDARVAKCVTAHFDAVEFDNVDGYTNTTGFPLTAADQLAFDRALAAIAHDHGLAVGLKNDLDQLGPLQDDFEFAIDEQCYQYAECSAYDAWIAAGKAVVEVEYRGSAKAYCAAAIAAGRDAMRKRKSLRARPWTPCR
jgi:hypothetical protein